MGADMQWKGRRGSRNIEDRRGASSVGRAGGVGGVGLTVERVEGRGVVHRRMCGQGKDAFSERLLSAAAERWFGEFKQMPANASFGYVNTEWRSGEA